MQILAPKQLVRSRIRIVFRGFRELPARPSFIVTLRIRFHDRDVDDARKTFEMADKVRSVREGAEETYIQMISVGIGLEKRVGEDLTMPGIGG